MSLDFVTVDLETTGFSDYDRIVEVAAVRTSQNGRVIGEFETVINPKRDIGGTSLIHGLTPRHLAGAPLIEDLWTDVAEFMNGAVMVAHNSGFDRRMLEVELSRSERDHRALEALCTLALMKRVVPNGPRRLVDCCDYFGIEVVESHRALADARMTSALLHLLIKRDQRVELPLPVEIAPFPKTSGAPLPRSGVRSMSRTQGSYLADLVSNMEEVPHVTAVSPSVVGEYFNLLDRALEDRLLDEAESRALVSFAGEMGISRSEIHVLHSAYMTALCGQALADGLITDREEKDLQLVSEMLQVSDWRPLLEERPRSIQRARVPSNSLQRGMNVCFTGAMEVDRSVLVERATKAGLNVKSGVSRILDLLVADDSTSESGKAQKARLYGTRIVSGAVFMGLLAELESRTD